MNSRILKVFVVCSFATNLFLAIQFKLLALEFEKLTAEHLAAVERYEDDLLLERSRRVHHVHIDLVPGPAPRPGWGEAR